MKKKLFLLMAFLVSSVLINSKVYGMTNDYLFYVSEDNKVSKDYAPLETLELNKYVPCTATKLIVDKQTGYAFVEMYKEMINEGLSSLKVCSGYRSFNTQTYLFNNRVSMYQKKGYSFSDSYNIAKRINAVPASSEHQLGLAVDVTTDGTLEQTFAKTMEGKWLLENAHKYGFVLSFPEEKQDLTGIIYEPWHYRYVGKTHAKIMYENNWCLKEYIEYLQNNNCYEYRDNDNIIRVFYGEKNIIGDIVDTSQTNTKDNIFVTEEKFDSLKYVYGHWAEENILKFYEDGVLLEDDYIYPNAYINRAQFANLIARSFQLDKVQNYAEFKDVSQDHKYYNSIKLANETGLISGENGKFYPNKNITRQEMFVMVSRALKLENIKIINFSDISNISGWAFQDVQKLFFINAINGYEDNTIKPLNKVTLAEGISFIARLMNMENN